MGVCHCAALVHVFPLIIHMLNILKSQNPHFQLVCQMASTKARFPGQLCRLLTAPTARGQHAAVLELNVQPVLLVAPLVIYYSKYL